MPENVPEGADIKVFFRYHSGSLSMFQIILSEQGEDQLHMNE